MAATRRSIEKENAQNFRKRRSRSVSFSARLPDDVCGAFADSICAVKYSTNPFQDMRESIIEMILNLGIHDWDQMEELVYCYIALNSSDLHEIIAEAFVSLLSPVCKQGRG